MCSARQLMVFNVCVKFHENMSSGFKVMERTRKIANTQRALTQKVGKSELRFMCSARRLMVFNVCVKFHENMSRGFKVMERTRNIVNTQRAITPKVEKPELRFMCSARRLMVFNVCVKFHENMSRGFKVMERTRKLLTDTHTHTHTHREKTKTLYPHGILRMPGV